jgi:hypothetical protein
VRFVDSVGRGTRPFDQCLGQMRSSRKLRVGRLSLWQSAHMHRKEWAFA